MFNRPISARTNKRFRLLEADWPRGRRTNTEVCVALWAVERAAFKLVNAVNCHVEQDQSPDPIASIGQSIGHLKSL